MSRTLAAFAMCALTGNAVAQLTVPDPYPTIQAALDAAEDGDEIVVSPGDWQGFDVPDDLTGITVRSTDGLAATRILTAISGAFPDELVDLEGFTVLGSANLDEARHCSFHGLDTWLRGADDSAFDGGSVYSDNTFGLVLRSCLFENDVRMFAAQVPDCIIEDCVFRSGARLVIGFVYDKTSVDRCVFDGSGGIHVGNYSYPPFRDCVFRNHTSPNVVFMEVLEFEAMPFQRCLFVDNHVTESLIDASDGSVRFTDCVFRDNTSTGPASVLLHRRILGWQPNTVITRSVFENNSTSDPDGAAVRVLIAEDGRQAIVQDSMFCENTPEDVSGAVELSPGNTTCCRGDLDRDGSVNFADILRLLTAWGPCELCLDDPNGDLVVDFEDLLLILGAWGACTPYGK